MAAATQTRGVALLSGGLDSGVAASLFCGEPSRALVRALFFDYGQRAAPPERRASQALAQRLQVPWECVELPWLAALSEQTGCAAVDPRLRLPEPPAGSRGDADSARAVWVPARNAVFVSIAAAFAEALGADTVVAGFNREEAATFRDNSAEFVAASNAFLALGTQRTVAVASPTLALDKAAIVAAARRLGYGAGDFWSCYEGGEAPCGRCESCRRSADHWG